MTPPDVIQWQLHNVYNVICSTADTDFDHLVQRKKNPIQVLAVRKIPQGLPLRIQFNEIQNTFQAP